MVCKLIIGIDLDNTIINYEKSFIIIAKKLKLIDDIFINKKIKNMNDSKSIIKNYLIKKNKQRDWEFLQGQVYGKYINLASINENFYKFLILCNINNYKVYIISHKSTYGHFDHNKINLKKKSINFLKSKKIIHNAYGIHEKSIYFCQNQELKIKNIYNLKCNYFIDDLEEIFTNKSFPKTTNKILLSKKKKIKNILYFSNWFLILNFFFNYSDKKLTKILIHYFTKLKVSKINKIKNKGNSYLYKIVFDNNYSYLYKKYSHEKLFNHSRLNAEKKAYDYLNKFKIQKNNLPLYFNNELNFSLIEWYDGKKIKFMSNSYLEEFILFIKKINNKKIFRTKYFNNASASCFSYDNIKDQIYFRINDINKFTGDNKELSFFLNNDIKLFLNQILVESKLNWLVKSNKLLEISNRILSPSDFGLHNVLLVSKKIKFLDFEYFGWDDPAKLICDFILHPSMSLNIDQKKYWIKSLVNFFQKDINLIHRIKHSYFLYGIIWCLIILNIYTINKFNLNSYEHLKLKKQRLSKSITLFKYLSTEYKNGFPYG